MAATSNGLILATRVLIGVAVAWALLLGTGVRADEGRIPIFEPVDITLTGEGGNYFLSRNISTDENGRPIRIVGTGVESVEIDLNGFTVSRAGGPAAAPAVIVGENLKKFVVRNGTVVGGDTGTGGAIGINVLTTDQASILNVSLRDTQQAIKLDAPRQFEVRRCMIDGAGGTGIKVNGGVTSTSIEGVIASNIVMNTTNDGIVVNTNVNGLTVLNNRIRDVTGAGSGITINADADAVLEVRGNKIKNVAENGIYIDGGSSCAVTGNTVEGAGERGIFLDQTTSGCLVLANTSSGNVDSALRVVGDRNHIERNVLTGSDEGLRFANNAEDNTFGRNTVRGNVTGANGCGTPTIHGSCTYPDLCDKGTGNLSFGDNIMPGPC